jgi:hypothetical protein
VDLSSGPHVAEESVRVRLLGDIRAAFDVRAKDRLPTVELLDDLHANEEAPWGDWYGKPLSNRKLAELLRPFNIRPKVVRLSDNSTPRGYVREQFEDAWMRYLDPGLESATSATSRQLSQISPTFDLQQAGSVAGPKDASNPHGSADVADVADRDDGEHLTSPSHAPSSPIVGDRVVTCRKHGKETRVEREVAGIVYLACGCFRIDNDAGAPGSKEVRT